MNAAQVLRWRLAIGSFDRETSNHFQWEQARVSRGDGRVRHSCWVPRSFEIVDLSNGMSEHAHCNDRIDHH